MKINTATTTTDIPDDFPLRERDAVRLVVIDATGRVLLLHTGDSTNASLGTCWELPGGGLNPNEDFRAAAVRELREETEFTVSPADVGDPTWRRDVTYVYRGERRLQHEQVVAIRIRLAAPPVQTALRDEFERDDCFGSRWWTLEEIERSNERFYPGRLRELLPQFLAGKVITEPFEHFS